MSPKEQQVSDYPKLRAIKYGDPEMFFKAFALLKTEGFDVEIAIAVWLPSGDEHSRMLALLTWLSEERKKREPSHASET